MSYTALPVGVDDFKEMMEKEYYYVDKTGLIKDILDKKGKVNLFTRPRRFGKTLNMSMLQYYFELPVNGESNLSLFESLAIMKADDKYLKEQGAYPVISLTLKSAKQPDWEMAYAILVKTIADEYKRHSYVLEGDALLEEDKETFRSIRGKKATAADYATALSFLSECLYRYHQKKVIILIDEYDVPLENAYYSSFYHEMSLFIRSLFESALKSNPYLEFAVITGCLRISRESIFTGLNNLEIISILNVDYEEYFGFTKQEVKEMLNFYDLEQKMDIMKEWYDGYRFGNVDVYNPWSIIKYVKLLCADENALPVAEWSNTSSNSIVRDLICRADEIVKDEIEILVSGLTIEKKVHEDITYDTIYDTEDNLWNFLFFTGYLKQIGKRMVGDDVYLKLALPNREVRSIYRNQIENWFRDEIKQQNLDTMYQAMLGGNIVSFQKELEEQLQKSISYMDNKEAFYHGFLLGLFANLKGYRIKSNREAGDGRYDICIYSLNVKKPVILLELKLAKTYQQLQDACEEALQQIEEKNYRREWTKDGYREILSFGVGFYKKQVDVKLKMQKDEMTED
ncbi:MAG: AAA family ATPase [Lachnospiraceae bacterium]|nr:AAA family ATPase [Lachnospiraceae bacterium]